MQSNEIENLYKVYSAVYDNNTRTELNESRDEISEMILINFSNADLVDLAEEILEETFIKYEMKVIEVETMIEEILTEASTLPGRVEKMKRLEEAFKVAFNKVKSTALNTAVESFSLYRKTKDPVPCVGNANMHKRLIAAERIVVKTGLENLIENRKYGYNKKGESLSPEAIEARKRKDDDLAGSPNSHNKSTSQGQRMGGKSTIYKEDEDVKEADTYDQVAAVIDMYRSKKGTDAANRLTRKGDTAAAKKERDYAAFEREKMKRAAQRSGHPWEHAPGSTTETEGKKSEKTKHVRDPQYNSYEPDPSIERLIESGKFSQQEIERIIEVDRLGKSQVSESGWHRRNPEKVGTPEDPDTPVLKGSGKVKTYAQTKKENPPSDPKKGGVYKPDKDGKMVRQPG